MQSDQNRPLEPVSPWTTRVLDVVSTVKRKLMETAMMQCLLRLWEFWMFEGEADSANSDKIPIGRRQGHVVSNDIM